MCNSKYQGSRASTPWYVTMTRGWEWYSKTHDVTQCKQTKEPIKPRLYRLFETDDAKLWRHRLSTAGASSMSHRPYDIVYCLLLTNELYIQSLLSDNNRMSWQASLSACDELLQPLLMVWLHSFNAMQQPQTALTRPPASADAVR